MSRSGKAHTVGRGRVCAELFGQFRRQPPSILSWSVVFSAFVLAVRISW